MKGNLAVARRGGSIELNGMWRDQCPSVCHWYRVGCWIYRGPNIIGGFHPDVADLTVNG